ncbi:PLP-dependent aminotransferase family protein [Aureimonas sp. AU20]|uniref:MocR-like pyridoxine biosynthesis transcription factor PdxR n=1 Tax=Aureimonas sp. AU20 TaxID=1349819 RepID=UPI000785488A|nr:PLP-dependent aminotransferase family protein [Aureimonas sp. AU20]
MTLPLPDAWLLLDRAAGNLETQIQAGIREQILDGRLKAGERLPSSRALALSLGIARSTVVGGFERLRAEGFIEGAQGAAMRVARLATPPQGARARPIEPLPRAAPEPERFLPFRPGLPDLDSFPAALWARCLAARARHLRLHDLGYGEEAGLPELRQAIAAHVVRARAVLADPEQVIVMPSAASILAMVADIAGVRGQRPVWLEEPGYVIARDIFLAAGARLVSVPCDAEGIAITRGEGPPPSLIYVTPSHQYPTGVAMSLSRRLELLDFARANRAVVIEDDYDSEFHYASRPLAALQGLDRAGCVVYVGTFSKVLAPGLRVAYAVLPPSLLSQARAVLRREGSSVPIHVQAALADFLNEGHLRAHIRRMQTVYRERMGATRAAVLASGDGVLEPGSGDGGLQLAAWFKNRDADDGQVARALHAAKIGAMALSPFYRNEPRPGLLFGIGGATPERIAALGKALEHLLRP